MEMEILYGQIAARLEKIDFSVLYSGFRRFPFALYDAARACSQNGYFPKPENFLGNTSVLYNGSHMAIWNVADAAPDMDGLASKIVHEMLHAYQNSAGESRWADERAALFRYRYDESNFSARLEEAACMKKCLTEDSPEAFARLMGLRRARMEKFPYEYDYEARTEQIEGTAHFVELAALEQLDRKKAAEKWENILKNICDPAQYYPARAITYLTGAAFLACLRRYTEFDTDSFSAVPFAVSAPEGAKAVSLPETDEGVCRCMGEWKKRMRDMISRAMEGEDIKPEGELTLAAWNVYDAYWDGKHAVLNTFIGYIEGTMFPKTDEELFAAMKVLSGDFVAEVGADLKIKRIWRR